MKSAFNRDKIEKKEDRPQRTSADLKIKADVLTPLEMFFLGGSGLLLLGAVLFWVFISEKVITVQFPYTAIYTAIFLALAALAFYCFKNTDNYYIIDTGSRSVLFHFKFFENVRITPYMRFDMISAVGVTGRRIKQKRAFGGYYRYWTYQMVLLERSGKMIAISESIDEEEGRNELNSRARELARAIECRAAECPPEKVLRPAEAPDGTYEPEFGEHDALAETLQMILLVIFVLFALCGIIYLFSK